VNYLAHMLLADPTIEARLGAVLGDFVKPAQMDTVSDVIAREILLHRAVDSYTDSHPRVLAAKARFRPRTRRFAGIVLDVFYDHALSRHWAQFSAQPLPEFIDTFYAGLEAYQRYFPPRFANLVPWMVADDWLGSYVAFDGVEIAVNRIAHRLSRRGDQMRDGVHDLRAHYDEFERSFLEFFPQLAAHVATRRIALEQASPSR
jgi:acyl carrier protein phosphodiesterase